MTPSTRTLQVVALIAFSAPALVQGQQRQPAQSAPSPAASQEALAASVVWIIAIRANGDTATGNGVVVGSPERVVTERSMLADATTILVRGNSSTALPSVATIVTQDTSSGIAILRAPGIPFAPVRVASRATARNDSVVVVTLEPGTNTAPQLSRAKVNQVASFVGGASLARLSATFDPERNGAPVMNRAGELVGIAFTSVTNGVNLSYSIPVAAVERLLASIPQARPSVTTPVSAATPRQSGSAASSVAPAAGRFSAAGLTYERLLTHLYAGEFDEVDIERERPEFAALFQAYLEACGRHCDATLPTNKVEMTVTECAETSTPVYLNGTRGPSSCSRWETRGTHLYADPAMLDIKQKIGATSLQDAFRDLTRVMSKGVIAGPLELAATFGTMRKELDILVQTNGCGTPAMKRFEENLRLYALGKQPNTVVGAGGATRPVVVVDVKDADFKRLLQDLVAENAASWVSNRYSEGNGVIIEDVSRDSEGRPAKLSGVYLFTGFNGLARGTVTLSFSDGMPECLYFFDAPTTCRSPNRAIVSAFRRGEYRPGYAAPPLLASGPKTARTRGDLMKACIETRVQRTKNSNSGRMDEEYWTPYCRCIERQYQPVLTDAEWLRYVNDYPGFEKTVIDMQPPRDYRLYSPQDACRS